MICLLARIIVVITLFVVAAVGLVVLANNSAPKTAAASPTSSPAAEKIPAVIPRWIHEDVIVTTKGTWVGSSKTLIDFRFTVENKYDYPIKDVRIKCRWFGASGTEVGDTDVVVYENFPAHRKRTAAELTLRVHPQSTGSRCQAEAYFRS